MSTATGALERVTPRIDGEARCGCTATIIWDEVYGWVHTGGATTGCRAPGPQSWPRPTAPSGTAAARTG